MDTDMGKSQETKNIVWPTKLKKKCKKRQFQGIHDRFLRDYEFRIRMIGHHRDEELCRRWDALADKRSHSTFDTTRIFPLQEQMVASIK